MYGNRTYDLVANYLAINPRPTRVQLAEWANSVGLPEDVVQQIAFGMLQGYIQPQTCSVGPTNPLACKYHNLPPVQLKRAGFGWPKSDTWGHGYPPKGWCLPPGYGPWRM